MDLKRAAAERSEEKASGRQAARGGYAGNSVTEVTKSLRAHQHITCCFLIVDYASACALNDETGQYSP